MQALWMLLAASCFGLSTLTLKFAKIGANAAQALTVRGLIALALVGAWCAWQGYPVRTFHPKMHIARSGSGALSLALFTYAIMALPLATGITLSYTSAIWLALYALAVALWTRAPMPRPALLGCIALSMVGMVLLVKPILTSGQWFDASAALLSGALAAVAYWQIRSMGALNEPVWRMVFYHSMMLALVGGVWWVWVQGVPSLAVLPWLGLNAVLSLAGQLAMTQAYAAGKTLLASNLQYLTVVVATVLGALFTHDVLDASSYAGIVVIVASCSAATALSWVKPSAKP